LADKNKFKENIDLFDELLDLLSGPDNAKNFTKIGGLFLMLDHCND